MPSDFVELFLLGRPHSEDLEHDSEQGKVGKK